MTYSKKEVFNNDLQEIALIARVLSHPARLAILQYLANCTACISGDISEEIPLSRTTVSQHLQELKKINLIQGTVSGTKVNYCLNPEVVEKTYRILSNFLKEVHRGKVQCANT